MRLSRRGVLITIGMVLGCLPLLGASCAVVQPFANSGEPKIQFEGDSITVLSSSDINAHYGSTYDVAIDAYTGATTWENMGAIGGDAANHPQVVVVDLGTNDAGAIVAGRSSQDGGDPIEPVSAVEARLDQISAEFAPACEVFVTIYSQDAGWYAANATQALANVAAINDHIRSMPGIQVADWNANVEPSYFDDPTQPHPNEAGRQAMLTLQDQAISRCSTPTSTSTTDTTSTTAPG